MLLGVASHLRFRARVHASGNLRPRATVDLHEIEELLVFLLRPAAVLLVRRQKSLAVEWAPVGAKKCLVARVEILMDADGAPRMTSFLVEDLDEVLELSD